MSDNASSTRDLLNGLKAVDLNVLVVFDALMRERNVTRAGKRIGLSQSATSGALSRLRLLLDDPLFVRSSGGVTPTPVAERLIGPVREGLGRIHEALDRPVFDPSTSRRVFQLAMADYAALILLAPLLDALRDAAPSCTLQVQRYATHDPSQAFEAGADMVVGYLKDAPTTICRANLLEDDYSCLFRADHALADQRLTVERYARSDHLLVSPLGKRRGAVDRALEAVGAERNVALVIPDWTIGALIASKTDHLLSGPTGVLRLLQRVHGLGRKPLPRRLQVDLTIDAAWPRRLDADPAHRFLQRLVVDTAKKKLDLSDGFDN